MAFHETPVPNLPEANSPPTEAIEGIVLPDGMVIPTHPLVLKGLEASVGGGRLPVAEAVKMYQKWDPDYPPSEAYKYFNG